MKAKLIWPDIWSAKLCCLLLFCLQAQRYIVDRPKEGGFNCSADAWLPVSILTGMFTELLLDPRCVL